MLMIEGPEELARRIAEKISAPIACGQMPIDVARAALAVFADMDVERTEAETTALGDRERQYAWTDWLVVRVPVASGTRTEPRPWPNT